MMSEYQRNRSWGVIQNLDVEADTEQAIKGAVMIALTENKRVTHFRVEDLTDLPLPYEFGADHEPNYAGANRLTLLWHPDKDTDNELPFELTTPTEVTDFIVQWLEKKGKWPTLVPDTDGSTEAGFRIENSWTPFYTVLKVTPIWIVYGK
jgi:hypothetical protein